MNIPSFFVRNAEVSLHVLDTGAASDPALPPLLICPGLSETADEYAVMMEGLSPRRCVALSFRGRGRSDSPAEGYDLDDHIADIEAVADALQLDRFHLFAHSRGVSYAIGYAARHPERVRCLALSDYPAMHKKMPPGWADSYIRDYLIPYGRTDQISAAAVYGIQAESRQRELAVSLACPLLVMRGMKAGSLVEEPDMAAYRRMSPGLVEARFELSGHDIRTAEADKQLAELRRFMARVDSGTVTDRPGAEPFPLLETPRLMLRRLTETDAPAIFGYMSQEIVMRYYDLPVFTELREAEQIIAHWNRRFDDGEGIRWAIVLKESGAMIGTCGFHNWQREHDKAELGYELSPEHWHRGYMGEALPAVIRHGFETMGLNRIEAYTDPENIDSIKVLLKAGLKREGLLREFFYEKNRFFDGVVFSMLRSEYNVNPKAPT